MMKCDHVNFISARYYKDIAGLRFAYNSKECKNCHKVLWSSDHESEFHQWLNEQKRSKRDHFTVQKVKVLKDLSKYAISLAHKHHRCESNVYQACLALYFVWGQKSPKLISSIDAIAVPERDIETKKFRVNPRMFVRLDAHAKLFDMPMNEITSWIIQRVLLAAMAGPHENNFDLLSKIEFALEAA